MKIYTKTGDKGETSLFDGGRVKKDDIRVESYGTIDELNSSLGFARCFIEDEEITNIIFKIQRELFDVAGELATYEGNKFPERIKEEHVNYLEEVIDNYLAMIPKVDQFIIPGTNKESAALHVSRTICRRAERRIISLKRTDNISDMLLKYVNRLSDTIYTLARFLESDLKYVDFNK
ncbi:cob(I)yrinic acid a,c-diamide adenosyltransferase [Alkaliphilus peptidifermentans]|uniref:Corrinoid adenosyltransferase n=1 Tax=Alkaliphilus peptidifermentans DSM 18978 TaxID=1120976 RepID=A0A1G5BHL5_9FIRM|nr:cob(I)yrinic acid a,c-diamide adenosyltransferase [Alkaliphilus peptidifermentans]SCX89588.1 cob(I)alamin adenosyltransferase [Alkaliphilus peptidifermentans DSM 18978]